MNQALNPSSIRFHAPVELPSPAVPAVHHLIAKPVNGHIIEARPVAIDPDASDYAKAYYAGRWLVVERDPASNRIRESQATYASAGAAYGAYWYATADDPLDWEAWVSPLFATSAPSKIVTNHIYPPIPDRSMDWCAYYDGQEERGDYGYGPTEQAAIDDLTANYERA